MIVREVVNKPELVQKFDFFNDGKDTMLWLISEIRNLRGILYAPPNACSRKDPGSTGTWAMSGMSSQLLSEREFGPRTDQHEAGDGHAEGAD